MPRAIQCPVANALDVVGDRWTLQVVRELLRGHSRFSELRETVEGIPRSILSARLKTLEDEGIISKRTYSDRPPRSQYLLTQKGHELGVVVGALAAWGEKYGEHDLSLVDNQCGHGVEVVYHCRECVQNSPRSRIRMVQT